MYSTIVHDLLRRSFLCICVMSLFCSVAVASGVAVKIDIASGDSPRATIEVSDFGDSRRWSFVDAHGTANGLRSRISDFVAFDADGAQASMRRAPNGDYESSIACSAIRYNIDLTLPRDPASVAHVSWLTGERGTLMLHDLLPRAVTNARVRLAVPNGWSRFTAERERVGEFDVDVAGDAVFFVGRDLRSRVTRVGSVDLVFVSEGTRAFGDDEAVDAITKIYNDHQKVFREIRRERVLIAISDFPQPVPAGHWRAEARGATLNYFSGRLPSRADSLARFTIAMAHEMLHFWVPNSLALDGAYDWFYEGFVEYQALRTCVRLGVIGYQDLLDAVARAHDNRSASLVNSEPLSLLDASRQRWKSAPTIVYNDGLLVAFLYDLTLRTKTFNRRTLENVFRDLLDKHPRVSSIQDGNAAVIAALDSALGSSAFTKRFIVSNHTLDLAEETAVFGFGVNRTEMRTRLYVAAGLTKRQHALHRELGRTY